MTQVSPRNCLFRIPVKQEWCRVGGVYLSKVRSADTVTVGTGSEACKPVQSSLPQGYPLPGPSRQVSAGAPLRGERLGAPADGGTLRGHLQPPELPRRFRWVPRRPDDDRGSLWISSLWRTWAVFQISCAARLKNECISDLTSFSHCDFIFSDCIYGRGVTALCTVYLKQCDPDWIKIDPQTPSKMHLSVNTKCWKR